MKLLERQERCAEILYCTAFVLWLTVAVLKLTLFKSVLPVSIVSKYVQYIVLALLAAKAVCCLPRYTRPLEAAGLFILLLFMTIAYSGGKLSFAVSLALIYFADGIPFRKLLWCALVIQSLLFAVTVACTGRGVLEDQIWSAGYRDRHGLGYTHCLLGSHFILFICMAMVLIIGKMTWYLALYTLLMNYMMYKLTDARTTMILSVAFVFCALVLRVVLWVSAKARAWRCLHKKRRNEPDGRRNRIPFMPLLAAAVPWGMLSLSLYAAYRCDMEQPAWQKLNLFLNGRIQLAANAAAQYGMKWFGQKIRWVGESTILEKPELVYNYVDNAFLQMGFTYGILFLILLCIGFSVVLFRQCKSRRYLLCLVLCIVLLHGMINPQLTELAYNPYLLLLTGVFHGQGKKAYMQ